MGNGVDFKVMAIDLRSQLDACEKSKADLLEALERLVSDFESEMHNEHDGTSMLSARLAECDYARAAIARARGEA